MSDTSMNLDELFERRLLVIVGKGGVGKTTVAAALALEAARRGKKVLLCEVDGVARAASLLDVPAVPIGEVREARPGLHLMAVEGKAALAEYLQLIIPVRRLLSTVLNSRIYQYFVAAAPGIKELMTMGKIWYEVDRKVENSGRHIWDLVIMDAPATGHSLQYLRMPMAARDAFTAGLVHREAQRVVDLLTDPQRTAVNLVTIAEELPVNETAGMYRQLHDDLHMPTGFLFLNRLHTTPFESEEIDALVEAASTTKNRRERIALGEVASRARQESGWTSLNQRYRKRLADEVNMPIVDIPYLFSEEFGFAEVKHIGTVMNEAGEKRTKKRGRA